MLPAIPEIRDSLALLSVEDTDRTSLGNDEIFVRERSIGRHADGSLVTDHSIIVLKQSAGTPMTLSALVERIASELHNTGHAHVGPKAPQRIPLASRLLAVATMLRKLAGGDALTLLNQVLKSIVETRVTQWAVL